MGTGANASNHDVMCMSSKVASLGLSHARVLTLDSARVSGKSPLSLLFVLLYFAFWPKQ